MRGLIFFLGILLMSSCKLSKSTEQWTSYRIDYYSIDLPPNTVIKFEDDSQTGTINVDEKPLVEFQSGYVSNELINAATLSMGETFKSDTIPGHIILIKRYMSGEHHQLYMYAVDTDASTLFKGKVEGLIMSATDLTIKDDSIALKIFKSVAPDMRARKEAKDKVLKAADKYRKIIRMSISSI